MSLIADLKSLEPSQRSAIWASYLGWTLDAFDFFLMVFMFSAIAKEFGTDVKAVSQARVPDPRRAPDSARSSSAGSPSTSAGGRC